MIPDRVMEVVQGPAFLAAGTHDERFRPSHTYVIGAVVAPDRETVTFFVPESGSRRLMADLESNGRVALGAGLVTHEAYQLKGTYVSSRPADASERVVQENYRSKLLSSALQAGYPEQLAHPLVMGMAYQPALAISFRVEDIFLQTPGPDAGTKLEA